MIFTLQHRDYTRFSNINYSFEKLDLSLFWEEMKCSCSHMTLGIISRNSISETTLDVFRYQLHISQACLWWHDLLTVLWSSLRVRAILVVLELGYFNNYYILYRCRHSLQKLHKLQLTRSCLKMLVQNTEGKERKYQMKHKIKLENLYQQISRLTKSDLV